MCSKVQGGVAQVITFSESPATGDVIQSDSRVGGHRYSSTHQGLSGHTVHFLCFFQCFNVQCSFTFAPYLFYNIGF